MVGYYGESRAAFFMLLFSVIGLSMIPMLPWMTASYDFYGSGGTAHMSELSVLKGSESNDDVLSNLGNDVMWIGYAYIVMTILAALAVIGNALNNAGFGRSVGYMGGGAAALAIFIIILHGMYYVHVADYNEEYGVDETDPFFGGSVKISYTIGMNIIPLVCAALVVPLSIKHILSLG